MGYFSLYMEFIKINFQSMMEERKAFFWESIAQISSYAAQFALIWVMIDTFKSVNGWGPYEVMFLYALNLCSYAIAGFFLYNPCTYLSYMIQMGRFDEVRTKPLNNFLYMICSQFSVGYIRHVLLSFTVMGLCIYKLELKLTIINILFLVITLISGGLIQGAAFLFTSVPSFWLVKTDNLSGLMWSMKYFIEYPISIYNSVIQVFLTVIVPFAFINFYPAQFFFNKNDFMMFHPSFQYLSPLVGVILFTGGYMFWKAGINRYESTGS